MLWHQIEELSHAVGLIPKIKVSLTFMQVIAALDTTYHVGLPETWYSWTAVLRFLGDLEWENWLLPSSCMVGQGMTRLLLLKAFAPLGLIAGLQIAGTLHFTLTWYRDGIRLRRMKDGGAADAKSGNTSRFSWKAGLSNLPNMKMRSFSTLYEVGTQALNGLVKVQSFSNIAIRRTSINSSVRTPGDVVLRGALQWLPASLVIAFCFTPSVCASIFQAWHCVPFDFDNTQEISFLAQDLSVRCGDSAEHSEIEAVAWVLVAIWPIGMVIVYLAVLIPTRHAFLDEHSSNENGLHLLRATTFLHRDYKPAFFWWEVVALGQRTILTGWLLLISYDLPFLRLLSALVITIAMLIAILAANPYKSKFDYGMAAGCQLLFVCIFICGIVVRLYEDIANDINGSPELAQRYLGIDSSEEAVVIMILVAFAMLAVLTVTLGADTYTEIIQRRLRDKWSVCTMDPPSFKWLPRGVYACFLSHYKMEAASDARYMHDMLRKMLKSPVFLDSSSLEDLTKLITDGVHKSDVLLVLATKGVFTRPWCLIEILEASRIGIPIVMLTLSNGGFVFDDARNYIQKLEETMRELNPSGLVMLQKQLGTDLTFLKAACIQALNANEDDTIVFSSHAGDNATVAVMKDVVERMAVKTRRRVVWQGEFHTHSQKKPGSNTSTKRQSTMPLNGVLRENNINRESAVFICCCQTDAIQHARVLRTELSVRLKRSCAVGGGKEAVFFINESEACVILLTRNLPTDATALNEIKMALDSGLPLITVMISGAGYDFVAAADMFDHLQEAMERAHPGRVKDFKMMLSMQTGVKNIDVNAIGKIVHASLSNIIAIAWSPENGRNHTDAVLDDIMKRIPKRSKKEQRLRRFERDWSLADGSDRSKCRESRRRSTKSRTGIQTMRMSDGRSTIGELSADLRCSARWRLAARLVTRGRAGGVTDTTVGDCKADDGNCKSKSDDASVEAQPDSKSASPASQTTEPASPTRCSTTSAACMRRTAPVTPVRKPIQRTATLISMGRLSQHTRRTD